MPPKTSTANPLANPLAWPRRPVWSRSLPREQFHLGWSVRHPVETTGPLCRQQERGACGDRHLELDGVETAALCGLRVRDTEGASGQGQSVLSWPMSETRPPGASPAHSSPEMSAA